MFSDNELNRKVLGKEPYVKDVELKTTITFLDKNGEEHKVDTTITNDSVHTMIHPYTKGKYGEKDDDKWDNGKAIEMVFFNVSDLISSLQDTIKWVENKAQERLDNQLSI
tara:strand:- start:810 stop:1139 length:330 start_codon:yes stop_codon:yes gene_type:complete